VSGPSGVAAATTEKVLPSRRMTKAESHISSFTALATMASNTGFTSVSERLITRRISALAVWLASASLVSRNRRAFWIAITPWSAKVCSRSMSFGEKSRRAWRRDRDAADAPALRDIGRRPAASPHRPCARSAGRDRARPRRSGRPVIQGPTRVERQPEHRLFDRAWIAARETCRRDRRARRRPRPACLVVDHQDGAAVAGESAVCSCP